MSYGHLDLVSTPEDNVIIPRGQSPAPGWVHRSVLEYQGDWAKNSWHRVMKSLQCFVDSTMLHPEKGGIVVLRKDDSEGEIEDDYFDRKVDQGAIWTAETSVDRCC